MLLEDIENLTASTLLSEELFEELFSTADVVEFTRSLLKLQDRAKSEGIRPQFNKLYKAYEKF